MVMRLGSSIPFASWSARTVVPNCCAIAARVSPSCTVYVRCGAAVGAGVGTAVGTGLGLGVGLGLAVGAGDDAGCGLGLCVGAGVAGSGDADGLATKPSKAILPSIMAPASAIPPIPVATAAAAAAMATHGA